MSAQTLSRTFEQNGYLVIEDVFDQKTSIDPVRREYADLLQSLIDGWIADGTVRV